MAAAKPPSILGREHGWVAVSTVLMVAPLDGPVFQARLEGDCTLKVLLVLGRER